MRFCLEAQCQIIMSVFSRIFEVTLHHFESGSGVCTSLYSFVDQLFTHSLFCEDTLFEASKSIIKVLGFKASLGRQNVDLQGLAESLCSAVRQKRKWTKARRRKKESAAST